MRKILLIGLLLSLNSYAQEKSDNYKKMIDSAITIKSNQVLKEYNDELNKNVNTENWKSYIESYKIRLENTYLIDENNYPYKFQSSNETGIKFKQIEIYDTKNRKALKKGIDVWKIVPSLSGSKLKIDIIDFKVTYADKKYKFANGGGSTFIYEYSCEEKKWILLSAKTNAL